jgi:predicted ArsR family transcriptional regulator
MDLLTYIEKRNHLEFLVSHRMVRTAQDIANKLEISYRTALRMVERLKSEGVEIKFCRFNKAYIIENSIVK